MKFILIFLVYLFIEVKITTMIGVYLGSFLTFVEIVLSMGVGVFVFYNFKHSLYDTLVSLSRRQISKEKAIALNIGLLISGILLFLPGMFSDIIGVLLQLYFLKDTIKPHKFQNQEPRNTNNETIIDTKHVIDEHGNFLFVPDEDRKENN